MMPPFPQSPLSLPGRAMARTRLRMMLTFPSLPLSVGSRTDAKLLRSDLSVAPRFLWECLTNRIVSWFSVPAASNRACPFRALGFPHVVLCDHGKFVGCLHPVPSPTTLAFDYVGHLGTSE